MGCGTDVFPRLHHDTTMRSVKPMPNKVNVLLRLLPPKNKKQL